ncbi:hypothetical protein FDZ84_05930 [Saccharopolyspora sp. ASAGF58]|nr:hypothetical protein FDZ84_05930 [Saccharopolyspora sp. ASAGF58]
MPACVAFSYASDIPLATPSRSSSGDFSLALIPRSSTSHTSCSGNTSTTGNPARAPTSVISAVVATRTSCPAARAAQINGTIGNISP